MLYEFVLVSTRPRTKSTRTTTPLPHTTLFRTSDAASRQLSRHPGAPRPPAARGAPPGPAATPSPAPTPRSACPGFPRGSAPSRWPAARSPPRSEEHTSELQSLMRISYAVFCLKKKKSKKTNKDRQRLHDRLNQQIITTIRSHTYTTRTTT